MDGDSPQSDLCEWVERLLMHWNLLQVVQGLPAVYHPGNGGRGRGGNHTMQFYNLAPGDSLADDGVFHVQVWLLGIGDEEL